MSWEQSGASRQRTTSTIQMNPKKSAPLLRRSRRQASCHGPTPGGRSSPSVSNDAETESEKLVPEASAVAIAEPYTESETRRAGAREHAPATHCSLIFAGT